MVKFHNLVKALLAITLALAWLSPAVLPTRADPPRVHPLLEEIAKQSPNQKIPVIIQLGTGPSQAKKAVAKQGGKVAKDHPLINGFSAELPARAVWALSNAPGVRWISPDAPMFTSSTREPIPLLRNVYPESTGAKQLHFAGIKGQGITVAVVDSGMVDSEDLKDQGGNSRTLAWVQYGAGRPYGPGDYFGHGSHVTGIIGGDGDLSAGAFTGMAPEVQLVNVKVINNQGAAKTSDVLDGLQWILDHKEQYNIRVVNLSMNSTIPESYHISPLDAALEILWFNGIVVVASAGNNGADGFTYPPANDPFVITVGATDDRGTKSITDDIRASFSAFGTTVDGFSKPDIMAPGKNIISLLGEPGSTLALAFPDQIPASYPFYFRLSGTSMAAPVVAGAVALLLQAEPWLNPDQVKYRLMTSANVNWSGYNPAEAGAGYLDIAKAIELETTTAANTSIPASQLLWTGSNPINWGSVNWGSVNWGSVNWGSVNWGSVNWGSVNWGSASSGN